ncbi:MAG: peptide ABC transporter substrate-binding protein [Coleofasciculus sp. Co-bin14]|nr:peptide ABC transporter substrate-binding protein [Coleofasciculus sp. Co-bin14]
MLEDFLSNSEEIPTISASSQAPSPSTPEREGVQILVIGSQEGVTNIVHSLHSHHFAEVREWSPLMPAPVAGKLMRMLIRNVPR